MWEPVPRPGIKPGPPALGAWSLNHCATSEVPIPILLIHFLQGTLFFSTNLHMDIKTTRLQHLFSHRWSRFTYANWLSGPMGGYPLYPSAMNPSKARGQNGAEKITFQSK